MVDQRGKAEAFHALHKAGEPVLLVNTWDVWSAKVVADAGFAALATSSYSVAEAAGYADGQNIPLSEMVKIVSRIAATIPIPLTVDVEAGFSDEPAAVENAVSQIVAAGAIGIKVQFR
ncbi:MAG: isocitrate lyase/phosphoenolpyruvate mutase family protein [Rhodomicrobium sp.]